VSEQPQTPEDDQQPEQPAPLEVAPATADAAPPTESFAKPPAPTPAPAWTPGSGGDADPVSDAGRDGDAGPAGDAGSAGVAADRPEIPIGAAFAGGFVLALILKRLAR
jgi:hypothetical protein